MSNKTAILAFGANLASAIGQPRDTIEAALGTLEAEGVGLCRLSSFYRSAALTLNEDADAPDFVNLVATVATKLQPDDLLALCLETERRYGRSPGARWSARTLDIDLIAYEDLILPNQAAWQEISSSTDPAAISKELMVPHPRMHIRDFILVPLVEVEPQWRHPVTGKSARMMLEQLRDSNKCGNIAVVV